MIGINFLNDGVVILLYVLCTDFPGRDKWRISTGTPQFHVRSVLIDDSHCSGDLPEFSMMSGHCVWFSNYPAISLHSWSWNRIPTLLSAMVMFAVRLGMYRFCFCVSSVQCKWWTKDYCFECEHFSKCNENILFSNSDYRWISLVSHQFMFPPVSRRNSVFPLGQDSMLRLIGCYSCFTVCCNWFSPFQSFNPFLWWDPLQFLIWFLSISVLWRLPLALNTCLIFECSGRVHDRCISDCTEN